MLTFFPADGQFPAATVRQFLAAIEGHDLVLGYVAGEHRSPRSALSSLGERAVMTALFGLMPRFDGIFLCRRAVIEALPQGSTDLGCAMIVELILRASWGGYRIRSLPTGHRPRPGRQPKAEGLAHLLPLFKLRWALLLPDG